MTPLIVIQARLGSKRLPRKVLMDLGGKSVLRHVIERCSRTGYEVGVACPDDDLEVLGRQLHFGWGGKGDPRGSFLVGGDTDDVLGRYAKVCRYNPIQSIIVRITADCPLVDPQLIEAAIQAVRDGADYAGNTIERHWPRGCDVEAFTTDLLMQAHESATDPYDREHVTPWMQRWAANPIALETPIRPVDAQTEWRWCLDTEKDFRWLQGAFTHYGDPSLEQAAAYARLNPPPND